MSDKELVGVKGWLLFLVLSLSVLSIIGTIASLGQFSIAEHLYPGLKSFDTWQNFKQWVYILSLASLSIRLLSAYRLYYKHEKSSVELAIFTLWTTGPVLSIFIIILMHSLFDDGLQIFGLKETIINFIGALCWTLYLNKSIRVKNTYYYEQIINKNQYNDKILYSNPVNISHNMPEKQVDMPIQIHKQDSVEHSEIIMNNNKHSEVINEDELYLQATNEVDEDNQDKALWAKCMALCEGDENKAKYKYIKERVGRIKDAKTRDIEQNNKQQLLKRKIENPEKVRRDKISIIIKEYEKIQDILKSNGFNLIKTRYCYFLTDEKGIERIFHDDEQLCNYLLTESEKLKMPYDDISFYEYLML
ncbi:MAG: hypothetical protein CVU60_08100 [Deltaproteobacteria bacterium HGW-Deltaproteobacteria-18]|jgi:hypothetical protein|nr:MAG: hypothetical protein CVU60_08100 [Deltaproteobacteria bacterium HGW-Deltaproteobacteria-18]